MEKLPKTKKELDSIKVNFSVACEQLQLREIYRRSLSKNYLQVLLIEDWKELFKRDNLL